MATHPQNCRYIMVNVIKLRSDYPYGANCYIVSSGGECAVVDPSTRYMPELVQGRVRYILLTHGHFDHILEVDSWREGTGAEVIVSAEDEPKLSDSMLNCYKQFFGTDEGYFGPRRTVREGDTLPLGDTSLSVSIYPGHTSGCTVYLSEGCAFVGDVVFEGGGFGRWDLPTGDRVALVESIRRITLLPEDTRLYCGHGKPTTVKEYKEESKFQRII